MTTLEIALAAALCVALIAIVNLTIRLIAAQRRATVATFDMRAALVEASKVKTISHGEATAREAIARDVEAVLKPFRSLLEQQSAAITRAAGNLGAAVTANGQRFDRVDALMVDLQVVTTTLKRISEELARTRDEAPETRVAARGPAGASSARRHPSIAPPESAEPRPPEVAQIAAGLGPRPIPRALPASATPHPRPVRTDRPPPATTLPPAVLPPRPATASDADAWELGDERPSDVDGERTRVGARPSPEALGLPPQPVKPAAPTLVSMRAVTTGGDGGGS